MFSPKQTLIGRLVKEPELMTRKKDGTMLTTKNGEPTCVMFNTLAIDNGKDLKATFIDFAIRGKAAENLANFRRKGDGIILEGNLVNTSSKIGDKTISGLRLEVSNFYFVPERAQTQTQNKDNDLQDYAQDDDLADMEM